MNKERPVTGSCERCRRAHDLLIPEPGSGDLHIQRIAARFAWCAGCDRLVGLGCCWSRSDELCADCAAAVATPGSAFTDSSLTSSALGALADAAVSMGAVEARLRQTPVRNEDRARNAWEDAWLEAGAITVRAQGAARVVRRRGPAASDGAMDRLATLGATWKARSTSMDDRLARVGLRIHALSVMAAPRLTLPQGRTADDRPARPAARGGVTTLAAPRAATKRPRVANPKIGSLAPAAVRTAPAPREPRRDLPTKPRPAPPPAVSPAAMPRPRPVPATRPLPEVRSVPVPMAIPARAPRPEPVAVRPKARGRTGRRLVVVLIAVLTLIGAGVAAATIDLQGGGPGPGASPTAEAGVPGATDEAASASPTAASTGSRPPASAASVTFDPEPLGPLSPDADGVALVRGAPEVAALPTSFDRSLRLAAVGDGVCLIGEPGGAPARAMTIDLFTGERPEAELGIIAAHRPEESVALALADIPGLAPQAWYQLRLAWEESGAISLEVRERDGGRAIHGADLEPSAPSDHAAAGSVCVEALGASDATAVHLDNVWVET